MTVFHDPRAPEGRTVYGGVTFVDGLSLDVDPSPETRRLFKAAGISETEVKRTEKQTLQAEAVALGLSDEGTIAELTDRINQHISAGGSGTNTEE